MQNRQGKAPGAEATVRVSTIMALPAVVRKLGANPAELLEELGLTLDLFDDPDNLISLAARGHLLEHCADRTGCPHLGLLIGQHGGLHSLGLIGLLAKLSPDVEAALSTVVNLFFLQARGATASLSVEGGFATFAYLSYERNISGVEQIGDGAVAVMFNILRSLCGPQWQPESACFAHEQPVDVKPYQNFFQTWLQFNAEQFALVFPASWLKQPVLSADADLLRVLRKETEKLTADQRHDFPEQVRLVLRRSIVAGKLKAEDIAVLFAMHPRTLDRRLAAFNVNYRELLDEVRFELARQLLSSTSLEVAQIAATLGYSRSSTFTRAFRRWSGATPSLWRMKQ
jgi:AraC-like DNA-binding protein